MYLKAASSVGRSPWSATRTVASTAASSMLIHISPRWSLKAVQSSAACASEATTA